MLFLCPTTRGLAPTTPVPTTPIRRTPAPGNAVGFLLGAEIPVMPERLSVQADWIGGYNEISVIVLGGVMTFRKGWQLSLGVQIPAPGSPNPRGSVIEYTLPGVPVFSAAR